MIHLTNFQTPVSPQTARKGVPEEMDRLVELMQGFSFDDRSEYEIFLQIMSDLERGAWVSDHLIHDKVVLYLMHISWNSGDPEYSRLPSDAKALISEIEVDLRKSWVAYHSRDWTGTTLSFHSAGVKIRRFLDLARK